MNYLSYLEEKNTIIGIKGFSEMFDSSKHEISKYKIICVMPDGKCLFVPYSANDSRKRLKNMYTHRHYLLIALSEALDMLSIDEPKFIEELVPNTTVQELVDIFISSLGISIFYDIGIDEERYTNFEKSLEFSEEQKNTILSMREALEKEKYQIAAIEKDYDDKSINLPENLNMKFRPSVIGEYIGVNVLKRFFNDDSENRALDITEFYEIINLLELNKNQNNRMFSLDYITKTFGKNVTGKEKLQGDQLE